MDNHLRAASFSSTQQQIISQEDLIAILKDEAKKKPSNFSLSDRNLSRIPSEIGLLNKLEKLDLENNFLILLPLEMLNLSSLRILNLGGNSLREFPAVV